MEDEAINLEIQVRISNLVSALGGIDSDTGVYKVGDEALACLRDLRKWLQNHDAKDDRLDVACAIANTTLVTKDIPEILHIWEIGSKNQKDAYLDRIALACLELLVPLTWPIEILGKEGSIEKFGQSVFLKNIYPTYKQALITQHENILLAVVKLASRPMQVSRKNRGTRDEGVLTLACSFFRNMLAIDSDRALTVKEFERQKVLSLCLTMASSLGLQFDTQDCVLLELVYYFVRSVDVQRLYGVDMASEDIVGATSGKNLKQLLATEEDINRSSFKPTRHSRFGTLISLNYGAGEQVSLSGQRGVVSLDETLLEMDGKKRWHKPKVRDVGDESEQTSYMPQASTVNSDRGAMEIIRDFTNDFLDSSFNRMFSKLQKLIDRMQTPRITKRVCIIYCYLVGWFIDAERARAQSSKGIDFLLIGCTLTNTSMAVVAKLLSQGIEMGEMRSTDLAHSAMYALRQILLVIRDMSYSNSEELRDVADGMKSRLFYEDQLLLLLSKLPRSAHRKSMAYACESIALTHTVLKMLDEYSKLHTYLFVKTHRLKRARKGSEGELDEDEDAGARRESIRVTRERKFTFEKFVVKYINDPTISTYERVLANFKEIGTETVLQIFSFLRRTFAKTPFKALFYRMSLMRILLELVDRHGLAPNSKAFKAADEFITYYVRKFVSASARMPSLHIQVNEIMSPADAFYYDHGGKDREKFKSPVYEYTLTSRALKEFDPERQTAVLVAALIDNDKGELVKWVEDSLVAYTAKENKPDFYNLDLDTDRMRAIHADGILRLFLRSLGLIVHTTQGKIVVPGDINELELIDKLQWVSKYQHEAVEFPEGKTARDFIKREGQLDADDYDDEYVPQSTRGLPAATGSSSKPSAPESSAMKPSATKPSATEPSATEPSATESLVSRSPKSPKRTQSDAFLLDSSDDDNSDTLKSIQSIRKRRVMLDDDE